MKKISLLLYFCTAALVAQKMEKTAVASTLDAWHTAASMPDFDTFFGLMSKDAVFVGTDATENWNLLEFKAYCKPHFDKGKAWSFKAVQRNVF